MYLKFLKKLKVPKKPAPIMWAVYGIFVIFILLFTIYHGIYAKSFIPGVHVGGIDIGGLNVYEASSILSANTRSTTPVILVYKNKSFEISPEDINLSYDISESIDRALSVGRSGRFFEDLKLKVYGIFKPINIDFVVLYNAQALSDRIEKISAKLESPHGNAHFDLDKLSRVIIVPESSGEVLKTKNLKGKVVKKFATLDMRPINLETENYKPTLTKKDLETVLDLYKSLFSNTPKFVFGGRIWDLSQREFVDMVVPVKKTGRVSLEIDRSKLSEFVHSIANEVNSDPKAEVFKIKGDRVVEFSLPKPGYAVREEDAQEIFSLALLDLDYERQLELPVSEVVPPPSTNNYGIRELLGVGYSKFVGSSPGRVYNIKHGSEKLNGILIAPGEVFSFDKAIGPIDKAHGFTSAYIISKGRTVLGEGGGVCQISTTVFRAALNAGLPILERSAHAYRVSYYEQDSPIGLDATVYQYSVDLRFKNDTKNYILIQSEVIPEKSELYFRFYGTSDGRKVTISDPIILSTSPTPPPLYQNDSTLPKGVVRQVDWSAPGAVVEVKRTVERDDEVLYEDTFRSNYQPWRAVYLVGTKE